MMDSEGGPLEGVKAVLRHGEDLRAALTDRNGEYCFCRVKPARDYVLELEREGYAGFMERDLVVSRSRISIRNVILDPLSRYRPAREDGESP